MALPGEWLEVPFMVAAPDIAVGSVLRHARVEDFTPWPVGNMFPAFVEKYIENLGVRVARNRWRPVGSRREKETARRLMRELRAVVRPRTIVAVDHEARSITIR